jgi:cytochrome c6
MFLQKTRNVKNVSTGFFDRMELDMKNMNIRLCIFVTVFTLVLMAPSVVRAQTAAVTYKAKCAGCHGADGKANTGPAKALGAHDFASDEVAKMSDADLIGIVTNGKNKMPAYGKSLKDSEIKDLVAYVRELAGQK